MRSPDDLSENDLLGRIRVLLGHLRGTRRHSPEHEEISARIRTLSNTYSRLAHVKDAATRPRVSP